MKRSLNDIIEIYRKDKIPDFSGITTKVMDKIVEHEVPVEEISRALLLRWLAGSTLFFIALFAVYLLSVNEPPKEDSMTAKVNFQTMVEPVNYIVNE